MNLEILAEPWVPSFMALFAGLCFFLFGTIVRMAYKNYTRSYTVRNISYVLGAIFVIISFLI